MSRYIDADALREKVLYHADTMNHAGNHEQAKAFNYCLCMIDDMPTADVVPMDFHNKVLEIEIKKQENLVDVKRGRWIDHKCSLCEFEPYNPSGLDTFNFCSNCGADMRGGNNDGR